MHKLMRRAMAMVVVGVLALSLGASAVFAGEVTGNGKSLKLPDGSLHGASICAFSGQNDTSSGDPTVPDEDGFFRTQNWGQAKAGWEFLKSIGLHPGQSCKPGAEE